MAALVAGAACGHTEVHHVSFQGGAPRGPVASTDLYVGAVPSRAHAEVGLLQVIGHGDNAGEPSVLAALRAAGRQRGCDAVAKVAFSQGSAAGHAVGVCVVWAP